MRVTRLPSKAALVSPVVSLAVLGIGCAASSPTSATSSGTSKATTHPVALTPPPLTNDVRTTRGAYWFDLPAVATANCGDYETIWQDAQTVARDYGFTIDRTDYRAGVLTTAPLVSRQFFEPWRPDVVDAHGLVQASLGSMRRIIRFEITKTNDGTYSCAPKVLIERQSSAERRITSVTEYKDVFSYTRSLEGTATDEGNPVIIEYWYAVDRDAALERRLASSLHTLLVASGCEP